MGLEIFLVILANNFKLKIGLNRKLTTCQQKISEIFMCYCFCGTYALLLGMSYTI